MKWAILATLVCFVFQVKLHAQGFTCFDNKEITKHEELLYPFLDGEYSKCLKKSYRFIKRKNYKNETLPYLIIAQANFELSKNYYYLKEHPDAIDTALAFASLYHSKILETNKCIQSFYAELRTFVLEEVIYEKDEADSLGFESIKYKLQKLFDFSPYAPEIMFFKAYACLNLGDSLNANLALMQGEKMLAEYAKLGSFDSDQIYRLETILIACAKHIEQASGAIAAYEVLKAGRSVLVDEQEYSNYMKALKSRSERAISK